MRFTRPDRPGAVLRLGYCLNVHPAEDLAGVLRGLEQITLPLRDRLAPRTPFGVGMYLPATAARELCADDARTAELARFLAEHDLDPFTYNAFPAARFHEPGLKRDVFRPTWTEPERLAFTLDVARCAVRLAPTSQRSHLSVSTHGGGHSDHAVGPDFDDRVRDGLLAASDALAELEREAGALVVLALEPEPRSTQNDTAEWAEAVRRWGLAAHPTGGRHLGLCLDTCHAAVEFEDPAAAAARAHSAGLPLGKVQLTSALSLAAPAERPDARAALAALDEPVYLHQLTAREPSGSLRRLPDLSALANLGECDGVAWQRAEEWRCHFHVPLDWSLVPDGHGLATTAPHARATLEPLLAEPPVDVELHVELETYTWRVLPSSGGGEGAAAALVDGLAREYAAALEILAGHGWVETPESPEDTRAAR